MATFIYPVFMFPLSKTMIINLRILKEQDYFCLAIKVMFRIGQCKEFAVEMTSIISVLFGNRWKTS